MAAKTARDIMSPECSCVGEDDTVLDAANRLAELDVGAMPICGSDDRLKGMITDRDIVVKVLRKARIRPRRTWANSPLRTRWSPRRGSRPRADLRS